jgi:hypothetical protein
MKPLTITAKQRSKIQDYVRTHHLPKGLGTAEAACSIAAINLALTGELTDDIPECMSVVIGRWIVQIQDSMPDEMRNSDEWKSLLPDAAGTGRDDEPTRIAIIIDWMWSIVLPKIQPIADKYGFGSEWGNMLIEKTIVSAKEAERAFYAAAAYVAADASASASADAKNEFWNHVNPPALLNKLIYLSELKELIAREEGV